jgi:hypothetical protein
MRVCQSAVLVLIAPVWYCPLVRASRAVELRVNDRTAPIVRVTVRVVLSPPLSEPAAPFRLLGFRRKAVLEETQTQVTEDCDSGLIPIPSPFLAVLSRVLVTGRSLASSPLRC